MKSLYYNLTLKKIRAKITLLGVLISTWVCRFQHGYADFNTGCVENNTGCADFNTHIVLYKFYNKYKRKPISYDIGKRKQIFLLTNKNFKRIILQDLESLQARRFNGMGAYICARTHEGITKRRMKTILRRFLRISRKQMNTLSERIAKVSEIKGKWVNLRF